MSGFWAELEQRWPESIIEPSLARISSVVELLGNPQFSFPVIRVTGTNGKTSTARMIESLLRAHGLRTGLFTSPHLRDPRERIRLNGESIGEERLAEVWSDIRPYVELVDANSTSDGGVALSYFEVLTAIAFATFADAPVDVAVVEVGMGGTWDATSVARAGVAVIGPVGMDHADYLGDTLTEIAAEKAGILVSECVGVSAAQDEEVERVLRDRAEAVQCPLFLAGKDFAVTRRDVAVGGQLVTVSGLLGEYADVFVPAFGSHQAANAGSAVVAVESFLGRDGEPLNIEIVREGFDQIDTSGRLQVVRKDPPILVDSAHNPHGARSLAQALKDSFSFSRIVGVVGVLRDKDAAGILAELDPVFDALVVTSPSSPRALPTAELAEISRVEFRNKLVVPEPLLPDAIDRAVTLAEEGLDGHSSQVAVVICGSVSLVGEALTLLL